MTETITLEEAKARVKRLNSEAGQLKMDLHDLAEDLPNGWEKIMEAAQKTWQKYSNLMEAREQLKQLEKKQGD